MVLRCRISPGVPGVATGGVGEAGPVIDVAVMLGADADEACADRAAEQPTRVTAPRAVARNSLRRTP
jgi:hypothetical protein